jgi:hypothetical protein
LWFEMRWAGVGSELWRVRVDLFAESKNPRRQINNVAKVLSSLLTSNDGYPKPDIGLDQGTGATGRPVVGLLFWVRADDVGGAATTAVEIARRAGENDGVGPELYDVVVIPRAAVVLPQDPRYPQMPT